MSQNILIKNATIIDKYATHNGVKMDILIEKGRIAKMAKKIDHKTASVIEHKNLYVSQGWVDFRADFRSPGYEEDEDLQSGTKEALLGGFTDVVLSANQSPAPDKGAHTHHLVQWNKNSPVKLHLCGSISKENKGKELSEMFELNQHGVKVFSDGFNALKSGELLKKALLYSLPNGSVISCLALDENISKQGLIHEGEVSVSLGLEGIPHEAEVMGIQRNLGLQSYTGGHLHFQSISTEEGLKVFSKAPNKNITADCTCWHLCFTDKNLLDFDSNYKIWPPLGDEKDRKALVKAIANGTIQVVCSNHSPRCAEKKDLEFMNSDFGASGLISFFGLLRKKLEKELALEDLIKAITIGPREILGQNNFQLEEGNQARLTLFDPDENWILKAGDIQSKSKNNPAIGLELKGKAIGIITNGTYYTCT